MLSARPYVLALALLVACGGSAGAGGLRSAPEPPGGMPAPEHLEVTLREWLVTGDGLLAAWAGWLVAENRLTELADAVGDRLVRTSTGVGPREHGWFVDQALLDALARTGGTAPGATLRRLAPAHTEVVTVLLCRRPAFDAAHLAVFRIVGRGIDYEAYVALGNVMAAWGVPAFAARILESMELRRRVRIWDQDPPYPPFRAPGAGVPGDGFFRIPESFPPVGQHGLSFEPSEPSAWTALSEGPRPVYTCRFVTYRGLLGFGGTGEWPEPRDQYRHEWLTELLGGAEVPEMPLFATIDIKWSGGRQPWIRNTTRAIEDLHARFRAWRDALHARGLLTDAMRRAVRPKIDLDVHDERRLKRQSLPLFPVLPFEPRVPPRTRPRCRGAI